MAYPILDKNAGAVGAADARDAVCGKGTSALLEEVVNPVVDWPHAGRREAGEVADCAT